LLICLRNDTACHWVVNRPLPFGLMQILKKKINIHIAYLVVSTKDILISNILTIRLYFLKVQGIHVPIFCLVLHL
jgi:hypothetical protein